MNFASRHRLRRTEQAIGFALLLVGVAGCTHPKRYPLQGQVVLKDTATNQITVNHGDIPGFMSAMTMPYTVKDPAVLQAIEPGDKVSAEVVAGKDPTEYWLENVRVTDSSARTQFRSTIAPRMLVPGEHVPDVPMVNQDGKTIHLSDFAGKAVLVTFLYTRCPSPAFCPRLTSQFVRIQQELKKSPADYSNTHLITISFDPKYDRPPVMRKYGLAYLDGDASGFSHWDFTSTSEMDLGRLAQAFGLQYEQQDNRIAHNMSIVLIAPDGTVANFWSTTWTTPELLEALQQSARNKVQSARM
jgi:protein SCO1/2